MRKKLIKWIILAVVLTVLVIFGCMFFLSDPPIGSKTVTDIDDFGTYNKYVKNQLADKFQGSFPAEVSDEWSDTSYYYQYKCAVFGDPNFCMDLQIHVENDSYYQGEKERISSITSECVQTSDGKQYYILSGDENDIQHYFDDEIHDGQDYRFEIVVFDDAASRIEYLTAYRWDNAERISCVDTVLRTISERKEK